MSDATTNTTSTFAPTTWASVRLPGARRTIAVRRGTTAWMTPSRRHRPTATQSPTAGYAAGSSPASNRKRPLTWARLSPSSVATRYEPRSSATTRAGLASRPRADGSNAVETASRPANASSGPMASTSLAVNGRVAHPTLFSFPVRFAYRSARPNAHSPNGMRTTPMTISGHDVVQQLGDRRPVDQALADAVEDVRRRRQARQHLHPVGQDRDRVVDAR